MKKKTLIILIPVLFLFVIFTFIKYSAYHPIAETCRETTSFAFDPISGDYLKYVECMKGYTITQFPDGGERLINQLTSGYIVYNNKNVKNTLQEKYRVGEFKTLPIMFFPNTNLFIENNVGLNSEKKYTNYPQLMKYQDGKIEKVRDVSFVVHSTVAIENNEVYYIENENIVKVENILTGDSRTIADLSDIKRNELYSLLYNKNVSKENEILIMTFDTQTPNNLGEYYSLDLNSGKLTLIETTQPSHSNSQSPYNIDPYFINYSISDQTALSYDLNISLGLFDAVLYKALSFFKNSEKHEPMETLFSN